MESDMLKTFLPQSNINDEKADLDEAARKKIHELNHAKGLAHLSQPKKSMVEIMNLPSKVQEGELNQKTKSHDNFEGYDHSLEVVRDWKQGKGI